MVLPSLKCGEDSVAVSLERILQPSNRKIGSGFHLRAAGEDPTAS